MFYVTIERCREALFDIALKADLSQKTPDYSLNHVGVSKLESILENATYDWYEDIFKKAAYLFVSINKGHCFLNGNKRLALVLTLAFLMNNSFGFKTITLKKYKIWFKQNFPDYKVSKMSEKIFHRAYGAAFYNLNKAVASSNYSFDQLKKLTEDFLRMVVTRTLRN